MDLSPHWLRTYALASTPSPGAGINPFMTNYGQRWHSLAFAQHYTG
jgi:hypothetical protein